MKKRIALAMLFFGLLAGVFSLIKTEVNAKSNERARVALENRRSYTNDYANRFSKINLSTSSKINQKKLDVKERIAQMKLDLAEDKNQESSTDKELVTEPATPAPSPAPAPAPAPAPEKTIEQPKEEPKQTAPASAYKSVMTTVFWIGEGSGPENGYITNVVSYWDGNWQNSFGGYDDPNNRCGYKPCGFQPKENPFYFALPYGERDPKGGLRSDVKNIPWYGDNKPLIKNRWIEIQYNGKTAYAQWQDVGPYYMDDFDYVFGNSPHKNTFGVKAGLDVSPAVWDYLGMPTNDVTGWRFVDESQVPAGPWKEIITTSKGYSN